MSIANAPSRKNVPRWRNWQTRMVQDYVSLTGGGGSTPLLGTNSKLHQFFRSGCILDQVKSGQTDKAKEEILKVYKLKRK